MLMHVAIILDGNRRYAKKNNLPSVEGHRKGAENVEKLLDWCIELGVKETTLYSFSMENFRRTAEEKKYLMNLFKIKFAKMKKDKRIHDNKIRIRFIGRTGLFPEDIQEMMKDIEEDTAGYDNLCVNFAMAYGGRQEIIDACKEIVDSGEEINEENFRKHLYMSEYPEIIIRTGGRSRISNFLLWQSAYSEWFFPDKFWPEFTKEDLKQTIEEFKERERRFGL